MPRAQAMRRNALPISQPRLLPGKSLRALNTCLLALVPYVFPTSAMANSGLEDKIADVMVWVVVVVVPLAGVALVWTVHVWPERVAEQREHPQKDAIKALCFLSLVFGGLLWPFAMLWAYMKPPRVVLAKHINDRGEPDDIADPSHAEEIADLQAKVAAMQQRLDALQVAHPPVRPGLS